LVILMTKGTNQQTLFWRTWDDGRAMVATLECARPCVESQTTARLSCRMATDAGIGKHRLNSLGEKALGFRAGFPVDQRRQADQAADNEKSV
jgi:hypothetical protein